MVVRQTTAPRQRHVFSADDFRRMAAIGVRPQNPPRFTVAEYERLIDADILGERHRVILLRGEVVEKMTIGTRHAAGVNRLVRVFNFRAGSAASVSSQNPVMLDDSEPEPDAMLLVLRADDYANQRPMPADVHLIVEVADSTLDDDLDESAVLYAENGIPEYWVVDLVNDRVHVHRGPQPDGRWASVVECARGQTLTVAALPGVTFAVAELLP